MFPIKYIENNLVFNHDGECFAYYELTPYNYSFLSPEEKYMVHDNFRQLIAQNRDGKIHALQIATEDSLRAVQERSKKGITGRLKEIACKKVDEQTEALVEMIGENQIDYRFFLGFKLLVNEEEISFKGMRKSAAMTFADFIYEVNHKLMGDFVSMSNDEINRFLKMEKLLESKISRRFQFRRLDKNDFGYLLEHIYGNTGVAYSDYSYDLPIKKLKRMKYALALALSHKAELLIMDEPTSGLDPLVRSQLLDILKDYMNKDGKGVFFSTHITSDLDKIADMLIMIDSGQIVFQEEKDQLLDSYRIIKGSAEKLNSDTRKMFLCTEESAFNFTGITKQASVVMECMQDVLIERPTIEDIMLANVERRKKNVI